MNLLHQFNIEVFIVGERIGNQAFFEGFAQVPYGVFYTVPGFKSNVFLDLC